MHCEENVSCWCETVLTSILLKARPTDLMPFQPGVHPGWCMVWLEGSHVSRTVSNRKWNDMLETGVWRLGAARIWFVGWSTMYLAFLSVKPWGVGSRRGSPTKNSYFSTGPDFMHLSMMSSFLSLSIMGNDVLPSFVGPFDPVLITNSFWIEFQTLRKCKDLILEGIEHF